ncbi:tRNA (5-methylaminomethyl-2-thiouridylate)-methyltransferase [Dissulfuribacter thermophilus]|uniref:tRNA (5-methylaminomethyl-2-thiouridylate)-methyltransferase n=1 Tax=Dissulfuribacter thermophilus TaxID=1156395 RepID=A0A1B9F959_9BACT|nr:hypothetical protein [Dissulfuribacter thermophilus]OCC16375.1 tRNA (5-methylaminomethyl-2-thiouridylate)-methyltransferase [Dissulfuribacter thermophilus]
MKRRGLVLFSGGLDSILASKVLEAQGIEVICIKFITPFFGQRALKDPEREKARVKEKYGLTLELIDISQEFIEMLHDPSHGYGKYLNPCLDCKILMVRKAVSLLEDFGASFVATGEVIGQRPMSQRRDAMRIVERDACADGLLLRPLCAKHMRPTKAEIEGIVDRSRLLGISGRGRKEQMRLAETFGIKDYPTPAGGCLLADPILSGRFKEIMDRYRDPDTNDFLLAQTGRHFFLEDGSWLVVGRNQGENRQIEALSRKDDIIIKAKNAPGPTALWRNYKDKASKEEVLAIFRRYVKKAPEDLCIVMNVLSAEAREDDSNLGHEQ